MTLFDKAAAAIGLAWSPEDAGRSTRAQPAGGGVDPERLRRLSSRLRDTPPAAGTSETDTVPGASDPKSVRADQQMLWVDGVGGYLVVTSDEVVLGQPAGPGGDAQSGPDVAILADLSRRHARIARSGGGYVLTPYGKTLLDEREIDTPAALTDGALLTLGDSVRVRFRLPHALSATARLEMESSHRTSPSADAVLLMAESCVLGPNVHSHVPCRGWSGEAILFRSTKGLMCRTQGDFLADGARTKDPIVIRPGMRIEGQDFRLAVEEVREA